MGKYINFTKAQIEKANAVDIVDLLNKQGEKLLDSGCEKRLAADKSITIKGNAWYDHSREIGGHTIDFVKDFYGLDFVSAMKMLVDGSEEYVSSKEQVVIPKKFQLPNANVDMHRLYAYLLKTRCIDAEVVTHFVKAKTIYESCEKAKNNGKEFHNIIFVGNDEFGVARHAHKHGMYTQGNSFKGNIEGSKPEFSFHHIGTNDKIFVFESPIDMLSYISMNKENWQENSYVALCGVSSKAVKQMLEIQSTIETVYLCLDNDTTGLDATERIKEILDLEYKVNVEIKIPKNKDWNEDLQQLKN